MTDGRVATLIVNYMSSKLITRCIGSLGNDGADVFVLDNSESDEEWGRLEEVRRTFPGVRLVRSSSNQGFGAGMNRLAAIAEQHDYEALWLLNPDTVVEDGAPIALFAKVLAEPEAIWSPLITFGKPGAERVWFAGGEIALPSGKVSHLGYGARRKDVIEPDTFNFVSGAAIGIATELWKNLGGFREDLFLYWEDVELSLRASKSGVPLRLAMDAVVRHDEGGTSSETGVRSEANYRFTARNRLIVLTDELDGFDAFRAIISIETLRNITRPLVLRDDHRVGKTIAALRGTLAGVKYILRSARSG